MERAEAEAIYDAGRDACVEVLLKLAGLVEQHELRLARLEQQARRDSRNSSVPASADPPKSRQQRRAEAREKAKELARREGRLQSRSLFDYLAGLLGAHAHGQPLPTLA